MIIDIFLLTGSGVVVCLQSLQSQRIVERETPQTGENRFVSFTSSRDVDWSNRLEFA